MKFQFSIPSLWNVQNTPQQVQMVEKEGRALMILTLAQGNSLEAAAQTAVQNYSIKVLDSKQQTINGLPAIMLVGDQVAQQQQQQQQQSGQPTVRVIMTFIQYGGNIYHLIGASSQADFNNYMQLFQSTMGTFQQLTDQSKINKQPERVRVKTVPQTGTLGQALASLRVDDRRLEELAILNGMTLEDRVERGMLIKVIE
jgi:predicted Zn-dependent protease